MPDNYIKNEIYSPNEIIANIAKFAGVYFTHKVTLCDSSVGPTELDQLKDQFFDSFGQWDAHKHEVTVDSARCSRKCPIGCSVNALIRTVMVHFCAKAVVHFGIHPITKEKYIGWNAPEKQFFAKDYPGKIKHAFYDGLVREQELFTQIFTYLYLIDKKNPDELKIFEHLSKGHYGLYELHANNAHEFFLIDGQLVRNWKEDSDVNRHNTIVKAQEVLGTVTRGDKVGPTWLDRIGPDQ